ncbi:sugar phosphate isomerase/epimerase family protein [Mongoliibacter ruber]|uniref:Sugar phosphate isomerase/epimerase n=1 Tax=Mongoliibacter ruber TaxID=1750599 RepID=A0A2T0WBG8_9BACT|nr:TIM barrel protein [Mongoliibacter ruber]PRY84027.1 sugar phosphate isomerase/epimerase [Mongoliibacter ruber]
MKKITTLLLGLFIILTAQLQAQEIALQMYSLRNEMKDDVKGSHQLIADWGIKYLEGGGTYGMTQDEYKSMISGMGLSVIGVGADYNDLKNNPQKIIDQAKAYGAKYATCFWIPHSDDGFSIKETREAIDLFNKAGEMLKKEGITLCYHPHGYEFTPHGSGVLFDEMVENAKHYKFNIDVFWVQMGGGDPVAYVKAKPELYPLLHLKDRKKGTQGSKDGRGDVETNVVLGEGDIDIKSLIELAVKHKIDYMIIEDESSRSVQQIPQSVAYINKIKGQAK